MSAIRSENCLQHLVDDIAHAGDDERVSIGTIFDALGGRSFGGLLLVPSLLATSPLSGVPGVPSLAGIMIILICVQYVLGRKRIWLPRWILRREVSRQRLQSAIGYVRPVVRRIDRITYPRLTFLINRWTFGAIALVCALLAATMPPLEILPMTATTTAFVIALFAIAVIAGDGLLLAIAFLAMMTVVTLFAVLLGPQIADLVTA